MTTYTLGIDFGTESARAVLVDIANGDTVATAVHPYADGVIDAVLPGGPALPPDWALQNPTDWLTATERTVGAVLADSGVSPAAVIGLGLDFTACTVLPTTAEGTPLCALDRYRTQPHAWAKLWKHHAAQPQANRINTLAEASSQPWLPRYGGKISSEWLLPKALQVLEEAPDIYQAAALFVEAGDWVVWQLTGVLARNTCAAGYKALWHKRQGVPSTDFLVTLHPELADLYEKKLKGPRLAPGRRVGRLTAAWARRLGLNEGTPVAAPIIDAHAGALGAGVSRPATLYLAMGTSTCHMLLAEREVLVPGISGVVEDGIVPGLFGYEAGQASVGDSLAWFVEQAVPRTYATTARDRSIHEVLTEQAAALRPGESGLLALDWWNGCRSTLVDAELSGLILGYTLATTPPELYRALIEATAFGTRVILDAFTQQGLAVDRLCAGGGLTKNWLLMQIYADITGYPIAVAGADQASALGAAVLGAIAAGSESGGYASMTEAVSHMTPPSAIVYHPNAAQRAPYDRLYAEYCRLYDYFGRGGNPVMKVLRTLRQG